MVLILKIYNSENPLQLLIMKYIYLLLAVLCMSTACQKTNHRTSSDETKSEKILDEERKEWIKNTLNFFQEIDEDKIKSGEESYVEMLSSYSETPPSKEDLQWFRNNIYHVDSLSKYGLSLLEADKYVELQNLLESELKNFQVHPNMDSYLWYDLIGSLLYLYQVNDVPEKELFDKMVSHLELFIIRTEVVQENWERPHPIYGQALEDLLFFYTKQGNEAKAREIETKLKQLNNN